MRVGTHNLPDEYAAAPAAVEPRVEAFTRAIETNKSVILDLQFGHPKQRHVPYDANSLVCAVHSTREYLFFRSALIKSIIQKKIKPDLRVGWNGQTAAHINFDVLDDSKKKAKIYFGLYKENDKLTVPCHTTRKDGALYKISNRPCLVKIIPTQAVATRTQDDLAGLAGEVFYGEKRSRLLDKADVSVPSLRDQFCSRAGLYVIAIPYVIERECIRAEVHARIPNSSLSWSILHWLVNSEDQIAPVPVEGSFEMPCISSSPEQSVA